MHTSGTHSTLSTFTSRNPLPLVRALNSAGETTCRDAGLKNMYAESKSPLMRAAHRAFTRSVTNIRLASGDISRETPSPGAAQPSGRRARSITSAACDGLSKPCAPRRRRPKPNSIIGLPLRIPVMRHSAKTKDGWNVHTPKCATNCHAIRRRNPQRKINQCFPQRQCVSGPGTATLFTVATMQHKDVGV